MNQNESTGKITAIELQHGKLYECMIDGNLGIENCTFVQLAIDQKNNRRFMLLGARHQYKKHLDYVYKLINMSFYELDSEDFDGDPDSIMGLRVWEFILKDGILEYEDHDCYLYDFIEIETILQKI